MAILLGLLFVIPMLFSFVCIYLVIKGFWYFLKAVFTGEI